MHISCSLNFSDMQSTCSSVIRKQIVIPFSIIPNPEHFPLLDLGRDPYLKIFSYLNQHELFCAGLTCKLWCVVASYPELEWVMTSDFCFNLSGKEKVLLNGYRMPEPILAPRTGGLFGGNSGSDEEAKEGEDGKEKVKKVKKGKKFDDEAARNAPFSRYLFSQKNK